MGVCQSSRPKKLCAREVKTTTENDAHKSAQVKKEHKYPIKAEVKVFNGAVFQILVDGNRIIVIGEDNNVAFYDITSGQQTHTLRGHKDHIYCGFLHQSVLITGSKDDSIRIWAYEEPYECTTVLKEDICKSQGSHGQDLLGVCCVLFDGQRLFSGQFDYSINEWDIHKGIVKRKLEDHSGAVCGLQFINENTMISVSYDTTVKIWDLTFGTIVQTVLGHDDCITCYTISGGMLVTGGGRDDRTIKCWNFNPHPRAVKQFHGHQGSVRAILAQPVTVPTDVSAIYNANGRDNKNEGDRFFSASVDGTVKEWDYSSGALLDTLVRFDSGVFSLALWGDCLLTGSRDGTVTAYDLSKHFAEGPLPPTIGTNGKVQFNKQIGHV